MSLVNHISGGITGAVGGFLAGTLKAGIISAIAYAVLKAANASSVRAKPLIALTLVAGAVGAAICGLAGAVIGLDSM